MQINCHTHIFNLRTSLTKRAVGIYGQRLIDDMGLPDVVGKAFRKVLDRIQSGKSRTNLLGYVPEDPKERDAKLLMQALREVGRKDDQTMSILRSVPRARKAKGWLAQLRQFAKDCKEWIESRCRVDDVLAWLAIAAEGSMDEVTDRLFGKKGMHDGAITTPLMMDIYDEAGRDPFPEQLKGTARQILRYPGRILPFVAVNPQRKGNGSDKKSHYEYMEEALGSGFVGVKLYPSLGDSLDCDAMQRVFQYCNDNRVPITMHCSAGGFSAGSDWRLCDPLYWWKYLDEYEDLTINFAHFCHFSGVSVSSDDGKSPPYTCSFAEPAEWDDAHTPFALQIVRLMEKFPGRVYTDVAYHSELWSRKKWDPEKYLARLSWLVQQPVGDQTVGDYLLWGSDFWMVRCVCSEREYWDTFTEQGLLPPGLFDKMAGQNARRFLGFDRAGSTVQKYVEYVKAHAEPGLAVQPPPLWFQTYTPPA
jgi:predicted TIM-barrel fold metal-dependent hydrolase